LEVAASILSKTLDFLTSYSQLEALNFCKAHDTFRSFTQRVFFRVNRVGLFWQLAPVKNLARLGDGHALNEVCNRGPSNCVCARGRNAGRNCIAPARYQLDGGARPLAKYHSNPNV
jgi:hypothetical protein